MLLSGQAGFDDGQNQLSQWQLKWHGGVLADEGRVYLAAVTFLAILTPVQVVGSEAMQYAAIDGDNTVNGWCHGKQTSLARLDHGNRRHLADRLALDTGQ